MTFDDIKIFLPKYLSSESEEVLYQSLKDFPNNIDQRIYTTFLIDEPIIFQGDGINNLLAVNLPNVQVKSVLAMILSNTCDVDPQNKRNYPSQIIYAPIINLQRYINLLSTNLQKSEQQILAHIEAVRKQRITQIFYLPRLENTIEESIVFLDRIYHIGNDYIDRKKLKETRLFTLSDFGNYLFLFKLSLHFTRIQNKVERKSI